MCLLHAALSQHGSFDPSTASGVVYADSIRAARTAHRSTVLFDQSLVHMPALLSNRWFWQLVFGCLVDVGFQADSLAPSQVNWLFATVYNKRTLWLEVGRFNRQLVDEFLSPSGCFGLSFDRLELAYSVLVIAQVLLIVIRLAQPDQFQPVHFIPAT